MATQYEFFIISAGNDELDEFNKFLRSVTVSLILMPEEILIPADTGYISYQRE